MQLTSLGPGQRARVVDIESGRGMRMRLAAMGLAVGTEVVAIQVAGGGPIVVGVGRTRLAIGRGAAAKVLVNPVGVPNVVCDR